MAAISPPRAPPPTLAAGASDLLVLSLAPAAAGKSTLEASPGALAPLADGRSAIVAALGQSVGGAPVFDRSGALAGLVAAFATPPRRIGAVALDEPHALIGVEAIAAFLALAPRLRPRADASARRRRDRRRRPRRNRAGGLQAMSSRP